MRGPSPPQAPRAPLRPGGATARVVSAGLALLLLHAAACDARRARERPVPPGDGVAPWGVDGAPVVICDGETRLVAPGPGGALPRIPGACVDPALDAAECQADAECGLRGRCLCGRCATPVCTAEDRVSCGPSLACVGTSTTGSNVMRCLLRCVSDADCAPTERCLEQADSTFACSGSCAKNADCAPGERCNASGACVISLCASDDLACAPGLGCALQGTAALARAPSARALPDGGVELWFERDGELWRARSAGGLLFAVAGGGPVASPAEPWEGAALAAPAVAAGATPGELRVFYAAGDGAGVGLLVSTDGGESYGRRPGPVLAAASSFEGTRVGAPAAAFDAAAGEWLLYYEGGTGAGVGLARSADGESFVPEPAPVLTASDVEDATFWRDVTRVGAPHAAWEIDPAGAPRVRLWFAARGIESDDALFMGMVDPAQPNESVGYAASLDGLAFEAYPYNPVFDRPVAAVNHLREDQPSVIFAGGAWLLYFEGSDESGLDPEGIVRAVHGPLASTE